MRQRLIVANWKMYKTLPEAEEFMARFPAEVADISGIEIVICPPFISLARLADLAVKTAILLGAQNMHWQKEGAFTGEISPLMLRDLGVKYVILGHSERRRYFGEKSDMIKKKVTAAFNYGLIPILCVGETLEQRKAGKTEKVVEEQLQGALEGIGVERDMLQKLVLAYEPVWAIGTGVAAGGEEAAAAAGFLRFLLREMWGEDISDKVRILYGGSVTPENIAEFVNQREIDGALVGGSSLQVKTFAELLRVVYRERRS